MKNETNKKSQTLQTGPSQAWYIVFFTKFIPHLKKLNYAVQEAGHAYGITNKKK